MGSFPYVIRVFVVRRLTARREYFFSFSHLWGIDMPHIHWVERQNRLEIPNDEEEVNTWEIHKCVARRLPTGQLSYPLACLCCINWLEFLFQEEWKHDIWLWTSLEHCHHLYLRSTLVTDAWKKKDIHDVVLLLYKDDRPLSETQVKTWVDNYKASLNRKKQSEKDTDPKDKDQE